MLAVKIGNKIRNNFRNIVSDINVKDKKITVTNKPKNGCVSYHRLKIYSPDAKLSDCERSGDWVSSQMQFIPLWVKEKEMPPRIDEWQMSHFHLWDLACSHWSAVMSLRESNVFVCIRDKRAKERRKKEGESARMKFFFFPSAHQIFNWKVLVGPHLSSRCHCSSNLLTAWQVFLQKRVRWPAPLQMYDCSFEKCKEWRGSASV